MSSKLWNIDINNNICNSMIRETNLLTTKENIVNFYHACLGSPTEQPIERVGRIPRTNRRHDSKIFIKVKLYNKRTYETTKARLKKY